MHNVRTILSRAILTLFFLYSFASNSMGMIGTIAETKQEIKEENKPVIKTAVIPSLRELCLKIFQNEKVDFFEDTTIDTLDRDVEEYRLLNLATTKPGQLNTIHACKNEHIIDPVKGYITCDMDPYGRFFIISKGDKLSHVYKIHDDNSITHIKEFKGITSMPLNVCFNPHTLLLIKGDPCERNPKYALVDYENIHGAITWEIIDMFDIIGSICISPDRRYIAQSANEKIYIFDIFEKKSTKLEFPGFFCWSMKDCTDFSPDSAYFIAYDTNFYTNGCQHWKLWRLSDYSVVAKGKVSQEVQYPQLKDSDIVRWSYNVHTLKKNNVHTINELTVIPFDKKKSIDTYHEILFYPPDKRLELKDYTALSTSNIMLSESVSKIIGNDTETRVIKVGQHILFVSNQGLFLYSPYSEELRELYKASDQENDFFSSFDYFKDRLIVLNKKDKSNIVEILIFTLYEHSVESVVKKMFLQILDLSKQNPQLSASTLKKLVESTTYKACENRVLKNGVEHLALLLEKLCIKDS